jgi:hypothetical protein
MIGSLVSRILALRDTTLSAAWNPLIQVSRTMCLSVLSKIEIGQIKITDTDGDIHIIGEKKHLVSGPSCHLIIHKETFWLRLALYADMVRISNFDP